MSLLDDIVARITTIEERLDILASVEIVPFNIGCRVYNSSNITITNSTSTILTFDTERFDTDAMHSISTNTSRITINKAGKYLVWGGVRWDNTSGGRRQTQLWLNGTTSIGIAEIGSAADTTARQNQVVSTIYNLAVGDYVEIRVFQTSGGDLDITNTANSSPEFAAWRLA